MMIRFKVVKASKLLLFIAIVLLFAATCFIMVRYSLSREPQIQTTSAELVHSAAETQPVFAARGMDVEVVRGAKRSVLIYHTHTHEAYEQVADDPYVAVEAWRTTDTDYSVVRVGQALTEELQRLGLEVVHDCTDHEGDQLSTAYTRSLKTLKSYAEPFDLYIDLHRDAWAEGEVKTVAGKSGALMAPLMVLIGNGKGFDEKPFYKENYAFACALEDQINAIEPGLCKPVLVKDGRYNQNIGVFAVLIEVGHNRNTLHQALNSIPPLAQAIDDLMIENPSPELLRMKADWEATR